MAHLRRQASPGLMELGNHALGEGYEIYCIELIKFWTGSQWVTPKDIHYYNGASWQKVKSVRRWNGSEWVKVWEK